MSIILALNIKDVSCDVKLKSYYPFLDLFHKTSNHKIHLFIIGIYIKNMCMEGALLL